MLRLRLVLGLGSGAPRNNTISVVPIRRSKVQVGMFSTPKSTGAGTRCVSHFKNTFREGEAPAEPRFTVSSARQEPRPPGFEAASRMDLAASKLNSPSTANTLNCLNVLPRV